MEKKEIMRKNGKNAEPDMKNKKKKITAVCILSAGVLALAIFAIMIFVLDLGPVREIRSSDDDARTVGNVGGYDVRYEELRYLTLLCREELDSRMGEYSGLSASEKTEYEQELEMMVLEKIKSNYVILSLCETYGVDTDSGEAKKYVKNSIEDLVDEVGGKKEYLAWLEKNHLTDALLRLIYKTGYLEGALLETLTEKGDVIKYSENDLDDFVKFIMEDESYIKVIHAFYPRENKYVDGWNDQMAKARAEAALARIITAEDDGERLKLMNEEIGKAPFVQGYSVTGSDYYITYGQMHEKYEDVAFSLDEYAAGGVVELDEGYYVIMRVPKLREEAAPRAYEFIDHYRYAVLKGIEDELRDDLSFHGNDYFRSLELTEIKQ